MPFLCLATTPSSPRRLRSASSRSPSLKRVGCDPDRVDGAWGRNARDALAEFAHLAKLSLSTNDPSTVALKAVSAHKERVYPLKCDRGETVVAPWSDGLTGLLEPDEAMKRREVDGYPFRITKPACVKWPSFVSASLSFSSRIISNEAQSTRLHSLSANFA